MKKILLFATSFFAALVKSIEGTVIRIKAQATVLPTFVPFNHPF